MQASSPFKATAWQLLGPTNMGARMTDIAVGVRGPQRYDVYAGSASGGLWKSTDSGTTWIPLFEHEASATIGSVAVAPSNPDIVWVGTGESNLFRTGAAGTGVYKSVDAGQSWQQMGLAKTYTVGRVVIHPSNPDIVYVAASGPEWTENEDRGVFKTTNGGRSWSKVLFINTRTGVIDLAMDPSDPNTLYASAWERVRWKWNDPENIPSYDGSAIYKSTDAGAHWTKLGSGLPDAKYMGRTGVSVSKSNPNVVYAFVDNYSIARAARPGEKDQYNNLKPAVYRGASIFRSDDKGATWRQVSDTNTFMSGATSTFGWVFGNVRVDPTDENRVYFMGLNLNVSADGGRTFARVNGNGGDNHALWIDPANPSYMINGNDHGIHMSWDRGATWNNIGGKIPVVQFFDVAFDMGTPFRVYGSVQDAGSRRGTVDLSLGRDHIPAVAFENAPGGEGSSHAIDPTNPNIVYSSSQYGDISRSDYGGARGAGPALPPDSMTGRGAAAALAAAGASAAAQQGGGRGGRGGGPVSKNVMPKIAAGDPPLRGNWVAPTIISPHDPNVIYHGLQYLFRSPDRGDTWQRISPDLSDHDSTKLGRVPNELIFTISESPRKAGLVYIGTDDGNVQVTRDTGRTWTNVSAGLRRGIWINKVVTSAFDEGTVYVAQTGRYTDDFGVYLYKSTNYGRSWTSIAGNIPAGSVMALVEDPTNARILYAGTDQGVYVTTNGGTSWAALGSNLPSVGVYDMIVHPRDGILVAATHGRGMWAFDVTQVRASVH
jgi:photosystem II stability/assembly factor-like uncharacterized protein